jgi:iron uptake system EfeUOB component EfeO/EfeM
MRRSIPELRRLPLAGVTGVAGLALLGTALVGCGSSGEADAAPEIAVTATDSACTVATTTLPAGRTTFAVSNQGSKVTEVYVYGERNDAFTAIQGEVEDIGPGTTRDLTVTLSEGRYEVACKPGQSGDGIRQPITVTATG